MSRAPQENASEKQDAEYLAAWNATMQLLREGQSFSGRERNCAFLNCGPEDRFANVSAVSGLDFEDDARVIAMVDWDQDGDLDCWLHNRTGPRLRLMQNQTISTSVRGEAANFLSIRLKGTKSNRDAIGARVEVLFLDSNLPRMTKTLYAGDAFLAQSSKTMHFGLGNLSLAEVRAVQVRWTCGTTEEFSIADARCSLTEGSGSSLPSPVLRVAKLASKKQAAASADVATRVPLINRPLLPLLPVKVSEDSSVRQLQLSGKPTLVVLWASWCSACKQELQELSKRKPGFNVVAIAVDATASDRPANGSNGSLNKIADAWQFKDPIYSATPELLDKLELLNRVCLNRETQLAVPTSYLVDAQGHVATVFRGAAGLAAVEKEVASLDASLVERRNLAVPFGGTWTTPPSVLLMRPVANLFRERGYADDYSRFLRVEMEEVKKRRVAATTVEERRQLDRQWSGDMFNIAFAHEQQRDFKTAADYYRQGLSVFPDDARAWQRLATCLSKHGQSDEAMAALRSAIAAATPTADVHIELAKLLQAKGDVAAAQAQLEAAIALDSKSARAHFHRGMLLASQGKRTEAEAALHQAISADPQHFESLLNLGALLASQGQSSQAIEFLHQATEIRPADVNARLNLAKALLVQRETQAATVQLQEVLKRDPKNAQAHLGLAQLASAAQRPAALRTHLQAAVAINPNDTASKLRLAWLLATCSSEKVRDAKRALEIGRELNEQANGQHPIILDTLAASYAAFGDFDAARANAQKAIEILLASKQSKMANEVQSRLKLYELGKAFVQLK